MYSSITFCRSAFVPPANSFSACARTAASVEFGEPLPAGRVDLPGGNRPLLDGREQFRVPRGAGQERIEDPRAERGRRAAPRADERTRGTALSGMRASAVIAADCTAAGRVAASSPASRFTSSRARRGSRPSSGIAASRSASAASSFSLSFRANATTGSTGFAISGVSFVPPLALPFERIERTDHGRELPRLERAAVGFVDCLEQSRRVTTPLSIPAAVARRSRMSCGGRAVLAARRMNCSTNPARLSSFRLLITAAARYGSARA